MGWPSDRAVFTFSEDGLQLSQSHGNRVGQGPLRIGTG